MCGVALAVLVKGHLGFQRFQAPRQMSLHGGFILHSNVLTTWLPVLKMPTRQDPRSAGPPFATYTTWSTEPAHACTARASEEDLGCKLCTGLEANL